MKEEELTPIQKGINKIPVVLDSPSGNTQKIMNKSEDPNRQAAWEPNKNVFVAFKNWERPRI